MPKNIQLAASLPATAQQLYAMYLDAPTHSKFTGAAVTISPVAGTPFQAFDGVLAGTLLHFETNRLIVQTWRSANWPSTALDSILTLSFWDEGESARY